MRPWTVLLMSALTVVLGRSPAAAGPSEPPPADSAVVDEAGVLSAEEGGALIAATQSLLASCDVGAAVLFAPPVEADAVARKAADARRRLLDGGILPRRSSLFLFADGDLKGWDRPSTFDRRLPPDAVTAAWKGTAEVAPFPERVRRFLVALSGSCGRPPSGTEEPPEEEVAPPPAPPSTPPPTPPSPDRLAKTGGFGLYLHLDFEQLGQPNADFLQFGNDSTEFETPPVLHWSGYAFEAFAIGKAPGPVLDTDEKGHSLKSEWTHRLRLFGALSEDERTLLRLTIVWVSRCVRPNGELFEYEEWTAAFTNVPLDTTPPPPVGNNPLAGPTKPVVTRGFKIDDPGRASFDHVLQIERRRGYPAYPETEFTVTHATAKAVQLRFAVT